MAIAPIEPASHNLSTVAAENEAVENITIIHSIFDPLQHNNKRINNGDSKTSSCPSTKIPIAAMEQAKYD
jgi:hypothetical protein